MRHLLTILLLYLTFTTPCHAQDEEVYATCRAYAMEGMEPVKGTTTKKDEKPKKKKSIRAWFACVPVDMAIRYKKEYEAIKSSNSLIAIDNFKTKKSLRVNDRGLFKQRTRVGMAIVCLTEFDDLIVNPIKAGQTDYEAISIINSAGGEVEVRAKNKVKGRVVTTDTGDGTETFQLSLPLHKDYFKDNSRLILQCNAVNCINEDTEDYCEPIVYEGNEYHVLQDRRKDYDFLHKDSLGRAYQASFEELDSTEDGQILINATIIYPKPDINQDYRGDWNYSIEDYHKPLTKGVYGGSCLKLRPFKFLNFDAAIPDMELTSEFQETAEINTHDVKQDLNLQFITGEAILTKDSLNYVKRDELIKELQSYGDRLMSPKVIGGASPDGSLAKNIKLARDRAMVAKKMIERYLPRHQHLSIDHKVYTWSDVADSLDEKGMRAKAQEIRDIIEKTGRGNDLALSRAIQKLPYYASDTIQTILNGQRKMQCTYSFVIERILSSEEVVDEFYNYKDDYLKGRKHFSSGDFFNLYANIADSTDMDSITVLAYKELKKNPDWFADLLSPYTLNKMQRLNQRLGMADTLMLKPYLRLDPNDSIGIEVRKDFDGISIKLNRRDLMLTQAMSYYQLQKFSDAISIFEWLKSEGKAVPGMEKLENFMNIRSLYGKPSLTDEQKKKLDDAKNYVLGLSDENKAILYTEIPEWSTPQTAEDYVDMLDDSNPKKWYLKGILWSRKADEAQPDLQEYAAADTTSTDSTATEIQEAEFDDFDERSRVRHYLAYFHHCFKMQPNYLRLYYSDGQIDDETRKKYKYLRKDVPEYERLFTLLQRRDAKRREELINALNMDNEESEHQEETTSGENQTQQTIQSAQTDQQEPQQNDTEQQ